MNIQETVALIEALRASGVLKFKSSEHEIELASNAIPAPKNKMVVPRDEDKEVEATEKLKNLINTINMSPEELANKMFPDGAM